MKILIALLSLLLVGCITPKSWNSDKHQDMMMACKKMCDGKAGSYEPWTGDCSCKKYGVSNEVK